MKKYIFTILIVLHLAVLIFAQTNTDSIKLFPVFVNGKYGYINSSGEMIIQPRFDKANKFHDGLALVEIESKNISDTPGHYDYIMGKQGYIDRTGKFVIEPGKYYLTNDFSEGLAGIGINNCKKKYCYGYIDTTGKVVIEPQFQTVGEFHEETADVRMPDDKWGVIDKNGKFIIPPIYDEALPFFEGVGLGLIVKNKTSSLSDMKISDFETVLYDKSGKVTTRLNSPIFGWFSEGLALLITETGMGFVDKTGKIIIEPKFEKAIGFSDGLCPVRVNKKWGYIDKTGRFVIQPQFSDAFVFSEGLAKIVTEGKTGYIDETGKMIIELKVGSEASNFEDGLAFANQDGYRGYINKRGKFVWKAASR